MKKNLFELSILAMLLGLVACNQTTPTRAQKRLATHTALM